MPPAAQGGQDQTVTLPALVPDYEREKLDVEILLNKAAYAACLRLQ